MTISSTDNRVSYVGNGVTTSFSFPWKFFSTADLVVIETVTATGAQTTKTLGTDYTVSGTQDATGAFPSGGTVTAPAPASGLTWTIYRDPSPVQAVQHTDNDPLPATSIDNPLDLLTCLVQRDRDLVSRALVQPDGDTSNIARLPAQVSRASMYLAFDSNGDPVATAGPASGAVVSSTMQPVVEAATLAAAATAMGVLATAGGTMTGALTAADGLTVTGAGVQLGAPTGGDKGAGTLNVAGHAYANGVRFDRIAQIVNTETGAVATGTTQLPFDDTIPQNTEGDQYMSLSITPTNAASTLYIEAVVILANSVGGALTAALFQDSTANALAASGSVAGINELRTLVIRHTMVAGATLATSFKARAGVNAAGTTTFNGQSAARKLGGVMASSITITEVLP